jgi:hypothetical protein
MHNYKEVVSMIAGQARKDEGGEWLYHLYLLNRPKLFNKFTMDNADITKYSSIKLDYLFCIIGII